MCGVKFMLSTYFTPRETAHVYDSGKVWKPLCTQRWTKLFLILLWIKSAVQLEASHSMDWKFKMKSKLYNYIGQYVDKPPIFSSEIIQLQWDLHISWAHPLWNWIIFPQNLLYFQHTFSTFAWNVVCKSHAKLFTQALELFTHAVLQFLVGKIVS